MSIFSVQRMTHLYENFIRIAKPCRPVRLFSASFRGGNVDSGSSRSGAIRAAGGAFAKMEIANEEQYFYKRQLEKLAKLVTNQILPEKFHKDTIKELQNQIRKHRRLLEELEKARKLK